MKNKKLLLPLLGLPATAAVVVPVVSCGTTVHYEYEITPAAGEWNIKHINECKVDDEIKFTLPFTLNKALSADYKVEFLTDMPESEGFVWETRQYNVVVNNTNLKLELVFKATGTYLKFKCSNASLSVVDTNGVAHNKEFKFSLDLSAGTK